MIPFTMHKAYKEGEAPVAAEQEGFCAYVWQFSERSGDWVNPPSP